MEYWGSRLSAGGLEAYKNSLGPVEKQAPPRARVSATITDATPGLLAAWLAAASGGGAPGSLWSSFK